MVMRRATRKKKIEFLSHEIILTFIGALILTFGALFILAGGFNWVITVFMIWLGLLVFILPIIWKIEKLM